MSENETEQPAEGAEGAEGGEAPTPVEETGEAKRLVRPTMLPVEGVVYCLDHTEVHDDTTDPYRMGYAECAVDEHRDGVLPGPQGRHRRAGGRRAPPRRVISLGPHEGLNSEERDLVLRQVSHLQDSARDAVETVRRVLGEDSLALAELQSRLDLADSVVAKLQGE